MNKYVYIKSDVPSYYVTLDAALVPEMYSDLGDTWSDFINNKWVLLNDDQIAFHNEHPEATIAEVWHTTMTAPVEPTLVEAKRDMCAKIDQYDNSPAVNGFTVNGVHGVWFTVQERLNYKESVSAAKLLGKTQVAFFLGNQLLTVDCDDAIAMLAQIQNYADACYLVTRQHKIDVEALTDIESVDAFDFTADYPEQLTFNISNA